MTQEQLKEQAVDYITNNLNNKAALEVIREILNNISSELYYEGFVATSNNLSTAALIVEKIVKED